MNSKQKQILSNYFPELNFKDDPAYLLNKALLTMSEKIDALKGKESFTDKELKDIVTYIRGNSLMTEILDKSTPIKGKHYFDGKDGRDGRDGKDGEEGKVGPKGPRGPMGLMGPSGKDASPDSPMEIIEKINSLKEVIDVSVIKGVITDKRFEEENKKVLDGMARVDGRIKLIDQRWHGGGLKSVSHDSTLTGDGTPSDPLSVAEGGSGGSISKQVVSGDVDGVNKTFTIARAITGISWINLAGAFQVDGGIDYTLSGTTITYVTAPPPGSSTHYLYGVLRSSSSTDYLTDASGTILTDANGDPLTVN